AGGGGVEGGGEQVEGVALGLAPRLDQVDGDPAVTQRQPRIDGRGELAGGGDHAVTGAPVEASGDERQPFGGVLHEGNVGRWHAHQPARGDARRLHAPVPLVEAGGAVGDALVEEGVAHVGGH